MVPRICCELVPLGSAQNLRLVACSFVQCSKKLRATGLVNPPQQQIGTPASGYKHPSPRPIAFKLKAQRFVFHVEHLVGA